MEGQRYQGDTAVHDVLFARETARCLHWHRAEARERRGLEAVAILLLFVDWGVRRRAQQQ